MLEALLVCPACRGALRWGGETECSACGRAYGRADGIPVLVAEDAATRQKREQASYFDAVDEEWEIERPWGAPRLHTWLLAEKFRRGVERLDLHGKTVVAACAGSGMDAELLARAGARVIAVDISPGAARRTRDRARRHAVEIETVVADVERLPFADRSVDVAFVHDGLHHLERPELGLAELARIAREAISVNEPAQAAATRVAVRAGIALEREESGNRVARLSPDEVSAELERHGFETVHSERYAMYYKHDPGRAARALSAPVAYPLARSLFLAANRVGGHVGNKLAVQAIRRT
jgi:SAM-dependent methyltransferase